MRSSLLRLHLIDDKEAAHGLTVEVPVFQPGPSFPPRGAWEPLCPKHDFEADLPMFWKKSHIVSLCRDEAVFREHFADGWSERSWFIHGHIWRAPHGELWAMVTRILPALNLVRVSAAGFEFSPGTWLNQRAEAEHAGEMLLGWIHTHSLEFLERVKGRDSGEFRVPEPSLEDRLLPGQNSCAEKCTRSGLFLSQSDTESAQRYGFCAPYQVTCILDSDACMRKGSGLQELLGVWGWYEGLLCRRSIHVIRDRPVRVSCECKD